MWIELLSILKKVWYLKYRKTVFGTLIATLDKKSIAKNKGNET